MVTVLPEAHQSSSIAKAVLLRRAPWLRRLDVLPFIALYALVGIPTVLMATADVDYAVSSGAAGDAAAEAGAEAITSDVAPSNAFVAMLAACGVVALAHIAVLLCEFWFVTFRAKVAWVEVRLGASDSGVGSSLFFFFKLCATVCRPRSTAPSPMHCRCHQSMSGSFSSQLC